MTKVVEGSKRTWAAEFARRWGRRLALAVAATLLLTTTFSWCYNAATSARQHPPAALTYVRTGDYLTRSQSWGTTGSPIVLVHGAFESADTWEPTAQLLAQTHRVYALDLAGFGYTQRHGHYTLADQAVQLLAYLDGLGLHKPTLVAHSSGAAIAAEAALRAPDQVAALLLLDGDALATGAGAPTPVRHLIIAPYRITLLRLAVRSDWVIRTAYGQSCGPTCPNLDAAGVDLWRRPLQQVGSEAAIWAMLNQGVPGLSMQRLAQLARLPLPKSVVFGAEDDVFSTDSAAQTADRIGAPAPTLIPAARHLTMISNPVDVVTAINNLAAKIS